MVPPPSSGIIDTAKHVLGCMTVIDKLKNLLTGSDDQTYSYRCRDCETEFESPEAQMKDVTCPECDSTNIRDSAL